MTRKFLLAAVLLLPVLARAEIGEGTIELQGSSTAGLTRQTVKFSGQASESSTTFQLAAGGLYYLTHNVGVGAEVQLSRGPAFGVPGASNVTQLGLVPKLGLDFPITQSASVFGEALAGVEHVAVPGDSTTAFVWGIGGGVKLFPMAALSVDLGLRLRSARFSGAGSETDTTLSFLVGLSGYFGTH